MLNHYFANQDEQKYALSFCCTITSVQDNNVIIARFFFFIETSNFLHKHTYSFKHRECLQLHCLCFLGVPSFTSAFGLGLAFGDSGFLELKRHSISVR